MRLPTIQVLTAAVLLLAPAVGRADLSPYAQTFEGLVQSDPGALAGNGWLVFANVFSPDHSTYYYGYGPFPAPNGGPGFSGIDIGQGSTDQGVQQLVVYNDYNNGHHAAGFQIEANVFQQQTIGAPDVGNTWVFRFDAKLGNLMPPSTALAFIKTLDPNNGYAMTNFITFDTTNLPTTWSTNSIAISIGPSLVGQILQFGFANTASNYVGSGVFYDNLSFAMPPVPVEFDFAPGTLNLTSRGVWVTGYVEPPAPYMASDIDVSSVLLNGLVPVDPSAPSELGDYDFDGIPDLMVKFDRLAVQLVLTEGDQVPVEITGTIGGRSFAGTDDVRVRQAAITAPTAGSVLSSGGVTQVMWEVPSGVTAESVALYYSSDGGSHWTLAADGLPNTGSYEWTVPAEATDAAKVAIVLVESADAEGALMAGVLGESEAFRITGTVGVGNGGSVAFALRGVFPNPAKDVLRVSFSLRNNSAATLSLFDVTGRQVAERRVDGLGAGWHVIELGGSRLPAGVYVIRLTQGGHTLAARAALVP
ncbi:MAG TPA: T9SS type A sorting domain-containing protein [Candidatus Eisenbacteria bacterium]|nr:T9SS type A sorting domain-containing protein [Candidatus Eisenbacteria bacterium]